MGARQPCLASSSIDCRPRCAWRASRSCSASSSACRWELPRPYGAARGSIRGVRLVALLGQAVPMFWLGIVLMFVFGVQLGWLPTSGYGTARHFVLAGRDDGVVHAGCRRTAHARQHARGAR